MEFKGTKGEWEVQFDTAGYPSVVYEDGNFICDVIGADIEAKANAQLIANSPKLLENAQQQFDSVELSNLEFFNKYGFNVSELHEKTKELINQATKID
jgi:hypothetical protein